MSEDAEVDRWPAGRAALLDAGVAATASGPRYDDLIDRQIRLADLQIENLQKLDRYETSHLRWRRFNDQMKGAMQIMIVAIGLVIVIGIGATVWNASRADGLVVDAFTVPPDLEARGATGDVVAGDITGKVTSIRKTAMDISYSISSDVSADRHNDIKVEIPETGVSISEVWRTLRRWLGHERHLTGNVRDLGAGRIALTTSLDGTAAMTETGATSDLSAIEQRAAEDVFGAFDPVNHINYLGFEGRAREALAAAERFVSESQGLAHADSYALLSYTTVDAAGDVPLALSRAQIGMSLDPKLAVLHVMTARYDYYLGHEEARLAQDRTILILRNRDQLPAHQHGGFDEIRKQAAAQIALLTGDLANATYWVCSHTCNFTGLQVTKSALLARLHDVAGARSLLAEGQAAPSAYPDDVREAHYEIDVAIGDWKSALAEAAGMRSFYVRIGKVSPRLVALAYATEVAPLLTVAQARNGHFAQAHVTIDRTPRDCVSCETARGDIDALEKNWNGAAYWFARATHDAPSLPFAYTDWGQMLLTRGQYDAAIARFTIANRKGPHFADPLEMWGEALMAKNRSDLALAKFEEANKYAPKWGRLHLKWGEALLWIGDKVGAQKEFATTAHLELTPQEKSELTRIQTGDRRTGL
jgi:tetratricopeptide (TPR) repeat protein